MNLRTTLVLSFVSFFAVSANAQTQVTQIVARYSGKCATLESTRQGAQIVQRACNGSPEQQWRMQSAGQGIAPAPSPPPSPGGAERSFRMAA